MEPMTPAQYRNISRLGAIAAARVAVLVQYSRATWNHGIAEAACDAGRCRMPHNERFPSGRVMHIGTAAGVEHGRELELVDPDPGPPKRVPGCEECFPSTKSDR